MPGFVRKIMGTSFVQSLLKARIDRMPEGPSEEVLRSGRRILVGVVTNARGESARARLTTSQGYVLTAQTGAEIARRVVAGEVEARLPDAKPRLRRGFHSAVRGRQARGAERYVAVK